MTDDISCGKSVTMIRSKKTKINKLTLQAPRSDSLQQVKKKKHSSDASGYKNVQPNTLTTRI